MFCTALLRTSLVVAILPTALIAGGTEVPATLAGHAALPAQTLIPAPADAPAALQVSGKYTSIPRLSDAPTDGNALPFQGQPVQGFSGIRSLGNGQYRVLTDNGFGSMANSPDAMLFFHTIAPDWDSGAVDMISTTFLSDPDMVIPFPIQMEGTDTRYLTGADFDVEGFQVIDGKIYIGDEFGPYLIVADADTGVIEGFHETFVGETKVMSPDHYAIRAANPHTPGNDANLRRSRGYEGFATSMDQTMLYPLLEGPIWDAEAGDFERVDGNEALRLLEWDVATQDWTGRSMLYRLEQDGNAIGDFNMIDETRGLVIERDWGQGDAALACAEGQEEGCFETPAEFKRVYLIDMAGVKDGAPVNKVAYVDLMIIADPDGIARLGKREDGRFTFPFVTIENVDRVDDTHIIVGNDNNFPFSKGRDVEALDNNEMILLHVPELLQARAE
ncbi:MAG: esterase-like activity of phytase family protein [Pseudomonadota bacterium]